MKKNEITIKQLDKIEGQNYSDVLIYKTPNGDVKVEVMLIGENLWLTQKGIAKLFNVEVPAISKHLKNIFADGELQEESTVSKKEIVQKEGERDIKREVVFYNLDAIISVGYRVSSKQATMFRVWANNVLKEYIIKGFAMNDERLKNPQYLFGNDYFEEQLERIREIRSSERRLYQKITDIYSECSADYDVNSEITKEFFASVQNKLHYAISGNTAAEIVYNRADSEKNNMGLTTWKNAPAGKIRKGDINIAKNYLNEKELSTLNRFITMYLDYAETQAMNGKIMYMSDWVKKLESFLTFNEKEVLQGMGSISHKQAQEKAESEFEKYVIKQNAFYESDFDKYVKKLENKKQD